MINKKATIAGLKRENKRLVEQLNAVGPSILSLSLQVNTLCNAQEKAGEQIKAAAVLLQVTEELLAKLWRSPIDYGSMAYSVLNACERLRETGIKC